MRLQIGWEVLVRASVVIVLLGALYAVLPAGAQVPAADSLLEALVEEQYQSIARSVVCIRTTAHMEFRATDPGTGLMVRMTSPISMHGTGVVIGSFVENGTREYLILSNDHVISVGDYFVRQGNFLRRKQPGNPRTPSTGEESFLVLSAGDDDRDSWIALHLLARSTTGDMALLRTVNASRALEVFAQRIGFEEGEIDVGASVITSGFPWGGEKLTARGEVLATDYLHELGSRHVDFRVSVPLLPGQSGSPVFLFSVDSSATVPEVRFTLIGLMHAREGGRHFMVPFTLWREVLESGLASLPAPLERQ